MRPNKTALPSASSHWSETTSVLSAVAGDDVSMGLTQAAHADTISPASSVATTTSLQKGGNDLTDIISDSFVKFKKMLGLTPDCLNGGTKTLRGDCVCPKYFKGELCEELQCINNGTLFKIPKLIPAQYVCKCPSPEFIQGTHCELVKCANGGRSLDNGHCKCLDYWYTGQFCQDYTASWSAVLGLPLICIVIVVICCVICRMDLFPRKPARSRRHRRSLTNGDEGRRRQQGRRDRRRETEAVLQIQASECDRFVALRPQSMPPSYIIRLDTIPAFNPRLASNGIVSELKPLDPPPPYEQVAASSNFSNIPNKSNKRGFQPPEYTKYPSSPPPPSFPPPDVPRR